MTDSFSLKSRKRVLITGASRGIGAAMARLLAKDGHHVVINYYGNHDAAEQIVESIQSTGGTASAIAFDVGDAAAVTAAYETLSVKTDPFGIIVNNAGVAIDGPFAGMKREDWARVLSTSLDGFFNITQPLTMYLMRKRWGRIVNVVSFSGRPGQLRRCQGGAHRRYEVSREGIGSTEHHGKRTLPRAHRDRHDCPSRCQGVSPAHSLGASWAT
jgi:NAD(P)-dependent dehydrogenase (short-subunit alcohol dehydrogenase family)